MKTYSPLLAGSIAKGDCISKPDSLGLSYRISADGNIDIVSYKKPKSKKQTLKDEIEQKECRCYFAALEINKPHNGIGRKPYTAKEDKDLCCVIISVPDWNDLDITISPVETPEENLDGSVSWIPAWKLWISETEIGSMTLPAVIAAINEWIVKRDLADETRVIFDSYQYA